jgi:AP-1 complex subunit gamma-1
MKEDKDLKRLILDIRKCKTSAEERYLIEGERALIRADISNIKTKDSKKCLNVSKIILMDLLGFDSSFAAFECAKLANSSNFKEKRIGYLGISCLLSKTPELVLLCTSLMKKDLNSASPQVISLALVTIATISDPHILISLHSDITLNFLHKDSFVRSKAIGAAISLIKSCPETVSDVLKEINESFMESSSTVFRSVVVLFNEVLIQSLDYKPVLGLYVQLVCGFLLRLYDLKTPDNVSFDPITEVYILKFLSFFGDEIQGEAQKKLIEIARKLSSSTKPCIKYELSKVLIKSPNPTLAQMGNSILQSFLSNPNPNLKFCGLRICSEIAKWDKSKLTIDFETLSFLSDPSVDIRNISLALSFQLITAENIQKVLKSYLNCLMSVDASLHQGIISNISNAIGLYYIDPIWHLDIVIRVAILAGQVPDQMIYNCIDLIRANNDIQEYSAKKLFYAFKSGFRQEALVHLAFWTVGEYCYCLDLEELEKVLENLVHENFNVSVRMYMANMLFKIAGKLQKLKSICCYALETLTFNSDIEVQQRSCEYINILAQFPQTFWIGSPKTVLNGII